MNAYIAARLPQIIGTAAILAALAISSCNRNASAQAEDDGKKINAAARKARIEAIKRQIEASSARDSLATPETATTARSFEYEPARVQIVTVDGHVFAVAQTIQGGVSICEVTKTSLTYNQ